MKAHKSNNKIGKHLGNPILFMIIGIYTITFIKFIENIIFLYDYRLI